MKLYDISQEIFSCVVYPGDPAPKKQTLCATEKGDLYNLTAFSMCAHNGTHVDAPFHFLSDGKTVDEMDLETFVGPCWVARHSGDVSAQDAASILEQAGYWQQSKTAGYHLDTLDQPNAPYFVFITSGEKKTTGYGVQVTNIDVDSSDKMTITVQFTEPASKPSHQSATISSSF